MRLRLIPLRRSALLFTLGALAIAVFALFVIAVTPASGTGQVPRGGTHTVREYVLPHKNPPAYAHDPAAERDGRSTRHRLWIPESGASRIGRIDLP